MSRIEWTDTTWNPVTGCDKVSAGCDNCYALTMAARLKAMGQAKYQTDGRPETSGPGFGLTIHPDTLTIPLRWRKPRMVFVNSMSDLFHPKVPAPFIAQVLAVMLAARRHTYQVLTKRPQRMHALLTKTTFWNDVYAHLRALDPTAARADDCLDLWPAANVWLGVSVEDQEQADRRIPYLVDTPADVRFLSCEPLLAAVDLTPWLGTLAGCPGHRATPTSSIGHDVDCCTNRYLNLVIVGGESGPGARPMHPDWVRRLRDQCIDRVRFFFKQWGAWAPADKPVDPRTVRHRVVHLRPDGSHERQGDLEPMDGTRLEELGKHAAGRELDGRTWDELPLPDASWRRTLERQPTVRGEGTAA